MRGLTSTERALLEHGLEWEAGPPMTHYEQRIADRLVRDGRAVWVTYPHSDDPTLEDVDVLTCTPLGERALRISSLAKMKVRL
jgi:hypothetical protein